MRNVDRKEAKSAAWIIQSIRQTIRIILGQAYEDEDDIEQILPFALALVVFDGSDAEVVFPGRFGLVSWIWKRSDWFAAGQANLLSGASSIGKSELASDVVIILY